MVVVKGKERPQMSQMPATLFPCASGVTMPQLGAEDAEMRKHLRKPNTTKPAMMMNTPLDDTPMEKRYLKKISTEMKFEDDVVKERCFFMMPYDSKYLVEALDISDLVPPRKGAPKPVGRHNASGSDLRHLPCGLKTTVLKPLKKKVAKKALAMSTQAQDESFQTDESDICSPARSKKAESGDVFLTELTPGSAAGKAAQADTLQDLKKKLKNLREKAKKEAEEEQRPRSARMKQEKPQKEWDAYLVSQLSELTATWVVHERMAGGKQQEELQRTLESWYGRPQHTDLVRDDGSEDDVDFDPLNKDKKVKVKRKWKKLEASLLERVYQDPHSRGEALDPYSDDNKAPFYRQPAGIRRQKKRFAKEEAGAINATAHGIKVKSIKDPKPRTLRDILAPGVGSTLYETNNQYEQELLAGVSQMHPAQGEDNSILVMESEHKYKKVLRRDYPDDAERWYPSTEDEKELKKGKASPVKSEHGAKRWKSLPEPYDDIFEVQKVVPPGYEEEFNRSGDPAAKKQVKQNPTLTQILHEWRAKWNLSGQYADATFDDIIRDMADIQPHIRLKAIATVGKAAEYKPPSEQGIKIGSHGAMDDPLSDIPERVFIALDCLLGDSNNEVRRAAAITLYALERPTEKSCTILRETLGSESSSERWAAAQCLAHFGVCDSQVVDEIMKQILASEEPIKHEQGFALLAKISNSTTLVHCMVAEQLNSSSWRYRVIACKILPTLYGTINKDVMHKLTELMWHDWHTEVRCAAAQCLGKTSRGRDVHDDIRRCIIYGNERTKHEAISRLGQMGIMTAKLLPAFLQCFDDEYISIRSECCITCGNLAIKEERIIERLVHLATFDSIWKVKALAIQALGKIGVVTEAIKDCLLWAMRYEEKGGVRAEACHSLTLLDVIDEDVIQIMKERLLVESCQVVRDEMVDALQNVGLSATDDMDMVAQIKLEVRKLCHQNVIAAQIVLNQEDALRQQNLTDMIYLSQQEIKETDEKRKEAARQRLRSMTSVTASTGDTPLPPPHAREPTEDDLEHGVKSSTTTPDPLSREHTMFTPSADKELEAIMNRDYAPSVPSGESTESKSRPVTGETESSGSYTSPESRSNSKPSLPEEYIEEVDRQLASATNGDLGPLALTPARSRLGMTPSMSGMDMKGSLSGRRTVMSRETLLEREKLNEHVSATYAGLTARYDDMVADLVKIDYGLNISAPGSSKFLTVPGSGEGGLPSVPSSVPPASTQALDKLQQMAADYSRNASTGRESGIDEDAYSGEAYSGETDSSYVVGQPGEEPEDGQLALCLEVPVSEADNNDHSDTSTNTTINNNPTTTDALVYESDGEGEGEGTRLSTAYPSLAAEDIAQHLLEVESAQAMSAFGSSSNANNASGYTTHRSGSDDNDSTLD